MRISPVLLFENLGLLLITLVIQLFKMAKIMFSSCVSHRDWGWELSDTSRWMRKNPRSSVTQELLLCHFVSLKNKVFCNKLLLKIDIIGMGFFQLCGRCGITETTVFVFLTLYISFSLFCHSAKSDAESFCHYFHQYVWVIFRLRGELIPFEPKPLAQHETWQT